MTAGKIQNSAPRARGARRTITLLALLLGLGGCAGHGRGGAGSLADLDPDASPVSLYETGLQKLAAHDLDGAQHAFLLSLTLARHSGIDFAPPHEGMARVMLERGKLDEANYEASAALDLDRHWPATYLVLGHIAEQEGNSELALAHYQHGLAVAPDNDDLTSAALALLRRLGRDREADDLARQAREVAGEEGKPPASGAAPAGGAATAVRPRAGTTGPGVAGPASDSLNAVTRRLLEPFFPDDVNKLGPRLLAVFQQPQLTRGALAVLAVGDGKHGLGPAFDRTIGARAGSDTPPRDIGGRPEEAWIGRALGVGAIEPLPDDTFQPDQVVTRLVLALWLEETIERLRGDRHVFGTYRGQPSPWSDLPDTHFGLNAARLAVDLGLLAPRPDGRFGPGEPVSTTEGVEALRRLPAVLVSEPARRP